MARLIPELSLLLIFINGTACRQMCLSCQYVDNPMKDGIECSTAPRNWTFGDTRMRCPFRCTINAQFDKKSGDPTFFYRGCSASNEVPEEGCHVDAVREYCDYSCGGTNYCNDRRFLNAPSLDTGGQEVLVPGPAAWFGAFMGAVYVFVK